MQVSHKHGSSLDVKYTFAARFQLLDGSCINGGDGGLGGARDGACLGHTVAAALSVTVERNSAVFGVDGAVMTKKKVTAHKSASALHALKWPLLGVYFKVSNSLGEGRVSAPVFVKKKRREEEQQKEGGTRKNGVHLRERSWRLRCSLLLKARLQNWHLYFLSGAAAGFRAAGVAAAAGAGGAAVGITATLAPGMFVGCYCCCCVSVWCDCKYPYLPSRMVKFVKLGEIALVSVQNFPLSVLFFALNFGKINGPFAYVLADGGDGVGDVGIDSDEDDGRQQQRQRVTG